MKNLLALLALACGLGQAETVDCHVSYGGETQTLHASTVAYDAAPTAIGSYFLFRAVFERPTSGLPGLAAIKLYTYADRDPPQGTTLLHQADYLYPPPPAQGQYGFTGLQRVYEPIRDGELQYWCGLRK